MKVGREKGLFQLRYFSFPNLTELTSFDFDYIRAAGLIRGLGVGGRLLTFFLPSAVLISENTVCQYVQVILK